MTSMTPIAIVSVLAVCMLLALVVIIALVAVCVHLYNARRRKVRQLANLNRELVALHGELVSREVALARIRTERDRLRQQPVPQASPTIGDRLRRGHDATVQFATATAPVVGPPPHLFADSDKPKGATS